MPENTQSTRDQSSSIGCLARFVWMAVGNAALFMLAVTIAQKEALSLSVYDLAFWLVPVVVIVVRFIDITRLGGKTVDAEPATLAHWRRYALGLVAVAVALWLAAHGLAATGWMK